MHVKSKVIMFLYRIRLDSIRSKTNMPISLHNQISGIHKEHQLQEGIQKEESTYCFLFFNAANIFFLLMILCCHPSFNMFLTCRTMGTQLVFTTGSEENGSATNLFQTKRFTKTFKNRLQLVAPESAVLIFP